MAVFSVEAITSAVGMLLAGLLRACIGGGLFIIAVWLVCRCFPRLPAAARFALWWLACAKLLVGFLCAATVNVPVALPSAEATTPIPQQSTLFYAVSLPPLLPRPAPRR